MPDPADANSSNCNTHHVMRSYNQARPENRCRRTNHAETDHCGRRGPAHGRAVLAAEPNYADIETVVVIYAENRSFDNLFGTFPGANGLANASPASVAQVDRDGKPMPGLPAIWGGTASKVMQGAPVAPDRPDPGPDGRRSWAASITLTMSQRYTKAGGRPISIRWNTPTATCSTGSTRTRCRSTAAPTTCSRHGRTPAA